MKFEVFWGVFMYISSLGWLTWILHVTPFYSNTDSCSSSISNNKFWYKIKRKKIAFQKPKIVQKVKSAFQSSVLYDIILYFPKGDVAKTSKQIK